MDSHVVVLGFEGEYVAEGMLDTFKDMETRGLLTIEDAVIASRAPTGNEVKLQQTKTLTKKFALRGSGVGLLAGLLLGGPIGGLAAGAALGGIAGKMKDYGIDDSFIKAITEGLRPDMSALFLMVQTDRGDEVLEELRPYKAAFVTSTTLTEEQERRLKTTFAEEEHHKGKPS